MKVILDIDENYANVLSVTAIGVNPAQTNIATGAIKIADGNYIKIGENGQITNEIKGE